MEMTITAKIFDHNELCEDGVRSCAFMKGCYCAVHEVRLDFINIDNIPMVKKCDECKKAYSDSVQSS